MYSLVVALLRNDFGKLTIFRKVCFWVYYVLLP